jgi:photosystem II stability/assembly factor-like uncharacterized protein
LIDPDDSAHWLLRATFGLLESHDAGSSWAWICEDAVGFMGGDPALGVLRGGGLLAGYYGAVSVSADQGCGWSSLSMDVAHRYVIDATLDLGDPTRSWILTASAEASRHVNLLAVGSAGTILETLDVGQGFVPSTVEVAPSNSERIYVTGFIAGDSALVLRSDDRGQSWQTFRVQPYGALPLYISAIDPNEPDRIYARVDDTVPASLTETGSDTAPADHLLLSTDAGETWTTIFSPNTDLLGFALSPDGSRVAAGGPGAGVYVASATALDFQPAPGNVQVLRCLRWTAQGLFACGQEPEDGWTIASSKDEAQTFTPLWHLRDLKPLECGAATTTGTACPVLWPDIARSIKAVPAPSALSPTPVAPADNMFPSSAPDAAKSSDGCAFQAQTPAARAHWLRDVTALGWLWLRRTRRSDRRAYAVRRPIAQRCPRLR